MEIKMSASDRFGVVAVKSGFITPEQLCEALTTQVLEELEGTKRRLIGRILYEKGYITMPQIDEVLLFMSAL
jgi:starvation-inducible outer membrane lipoprotein